MAFMSQMVPLSDTIFLSKIPFELPVGLDAWGRREKPQPVFITLHISAAIEAAAARDDVSQTLDYGKLYKRLSANIDIIDDGTNQLSLPKLLETIDQSINPSGSTEAMPITILIELPKAVLRSSGGIRYSAVRVAEGSELYACSLEISKIDCSCIVGVNPHERREKQGIFVSLEFHTRVSSQHGVGLPNSTFMPPDDMTKLVTGGYQTMVKEMCELVSGTAYETIEALATFIARYITMEFGVESVTVTIEKPSAISMIEAAGVKLTRTRSFFEKNNFWGQGLLTQ